ncbi:MAG: molybdate ABC transporter permease subunit [Myxacorys californica WJT36-NPBG1]|jgi:molybdate transport system permease protein|nr:molybdate ABC transporter permease subunit [Myxacorys californica WJT36-NPBG1]
MPPALSPLWISLKTALLATGITFFFGVAAAYWMLNYRGKGKALIESIFVAPLILPPTVVGFILLVLFGKNGAIGQLLNSIDFSVVFTWYGAVVAATVVSFPLMYRTALGTFEQIDQNLLAVAKTLGASDWTIFRSILLPLSTSGILAGITLAFARALGEFGATLMLAGNIPEETQTIPMAIYFAVEAGATNEAWFWAIAIMGISLSSIAAANLWQDKRKPQAVKREPFSPVLKPVLAPLLDVADSPNRGLSVEIGKQLGGFRVEIAFHADAPLGVLGASGAGKSLMLRCIAGIETPTSGRIVLNGRVLFDADRDINLASRDRRIGFLVQNYALFPHMTVAQNIAFGLPKGLSRSGVRQQVESQLMAVQLEEMHDRYPAQLSGGQQQRVALARALASQPEALLLDEPFSALDTHLRSQLEQQLIARLASYPGAVLFVTHNLEEAYRVCPNLLVMHGGRAIAFGSKRSIFERPATVTVAQLTGCKNFSTAVATADNHIHAIEWGISLQIAEPLPEQFAYVGIRAHQILFPQDAQQPNTFPCWVAATSETPHRMTIFLKFNAPPTSPQDYHLQAEVFKEKWFALKAQPLPWMVCLDSLRLILLTAA